MRDAPTAEGALDNDVFVPIADAAARALVSGDEVLERARAAGPTAEGARLLDSALDHWREALNSGGAGASTWFDPAPSAERRLSEGLRAGLLRRLAALSDGERARWSERLAPSADQALRTLLAIHSPDERAARAREIARLFPLTQAAERAMLELVDLALEAGLSAGASGWIARAEEEAALAGGPAFQAALEKRRAVLPQPAEHDEAWQSAGAIDPGGTFLWNEEGRREEGPLERRPRPGGVFLEDGRFALQTASAVFLLAVEGTGELRQLARLRPADFLGAYAPDPVLDAPSEPPGWPLLPLADRERLILVVGRTQPAEPNVLLALEIEATQPHQELGLELGRTQPVARLAWAIAGAERILPDGTVPLPELAELGDYEFQPGPVASGDLIVVQARQFDGQVRAWLLGFDRRDGSLAWARWLANGADRIPVQRFAPTTKRVAGQPLLALPGAGGGRVFVGTHLGLGVLFDALPGEPSWSFKNRRRAERDPGWSGDRPLFSANDGEAAVILWGPMDSDRLYTVRPLALRAERSEGEAVLERPPTMLFQSKALLGGDAEEHVVLGDGPEPRLSARRPGNDRVESLELGREERFRGLGLVSPQRAWASTDRALYLFDRTRELYLLEREGLAPAGAEPGGGDLQARGAHVLVVGASALWSFLAR
jgi:hypothetical protein